MSSHRCRLCGANLTRTFADLGMSPLCESYVAADQTDAPPVSTSSPTTPTFRIFELRHAQYSIRLRYVISGGIQRLRCGFPVNL